MTLAALSFYRIYQNDFQDWDKSKEGLCLGIDITLAVALASLAALTATGILFSHLPTGLQVTQNPAFGAFLGGTVLIGLSDIVARALFAYIKEHLAIQADPWPIEDNIIPSHPIVEESPNYTAVLTFPLQIATDGTLLPCKVMIGLIGEWNEAEKEAIKMKTENTVWLYSNSRKNYAFNLILSEELTIPPHRPLPENFVLHISSPMYLTIIGEDAPIQLPPSSKIGNNQRWLEVHVLPIDDKTNDPKPAPKITRQNNVKDIAWFANPFSWSNCDKHNQNHFWISDVILFIFKHLQFNDQVKYATSCKKFGHVCTENNAYGENALNWYHAVYLPQRIISAGYGPKITYPHSLVFKDWVEICQQAEASIFMSHPSDNLCIWDANTFLPTIWPQDKVCMIGSLGNAYFCSIGLRLTVRVPTQNRDSTQNKVTTFWDICTVYCLDGMSISGFIYPEKFYEWKIISRSHSPLDTTGIYTVHTARSLPIKSSPQEILQRAVHYHHRHFLGKLSNSENRDWIVVSPPPAPQS